MSMPRWLAAGILVLLLAGGIWVRAGRLAARPFWRDEAWVAERVTTGTWAETLRPVDLPLPAGFAAALRLSELIKVPAELGLRLTPLVAGCAVLPLHYVLVRRVRGTRLQALAAAGAATVSIPLIAFSRELKQYEVEAFLGTVVALLVVGVERHPGKHAWASWPMAGLAALLAVGPWMGYGFLFPAAALLGYLAWRGYRERRRRDLLLAAALGGAVLAASFATVYVTLARHQASAPLAAAMYPWLIDPREAHSVFRAGLYTVGLVSMDVLPLEWNDSYEVHAFVSIPLLLLVVMGWWALRRRAGGLLFFWLVGAALLNALASVLRVYPYGVLRMMLFLLPPLVILISAGVLAAGRTISRAVFGRRGPGALVGALVLLGPLVYIPDLQRRQAFWIYHDIPAVLQRLDAVRQPQDLVLVDLTVAPCVRYYRGTTAGFALPTLVSGTLTPSETRYHEWCRARLKWLSGRAWLLRSSEPSEVDWRRLAREFGYDYRVEAVAGGNLGGAAQLVLVQKP